MRGRLQATDAAMHVADQKRLTSIAFPALRTAVGGFRTDECARVMVSAVTDYLNHTRNTGITRVDFVLRDDKARGHSQSAIERSG